MKVYEKPMLEELDFMFEESLATNNNGNNKKKSGKKENCHAERGKKKCEPARFWSHYHPWTP